jgi:alpha-ribazole phosphatase
MNPSDCALAPGVSVRLILIRHGEPEASARGRCYGKLDLSLSDQGREQIRRAARWLEKMPLTVVYSSPRRRAYESAKVIALERQLDISVEAELCEIDFGELEGLTYDEVARRYPDEYRAWMERPTEITFPGGESFMTMRERVLRCAARIRASHSGQMVAVVTHGGVNRVVLADALGIAPRDIFRLDQSYAAISVIDYYDQTPVVRLVNYSA